MKQLSENERMASGDVRKVISTLQSYFELDDETLHGTLCRLIKEGDARHKKLRDAYHNWRPDYNPAGARD